MSLCERDTRARSVHPGSPIHRASRRIRGSTFRCPYTLRSFISHRRRVAQTSTTSTVARVHPSAAGERRNEIRRESGGGMGGATQRAGKFENLEHAKSQSDMFTLSLFLRGPTFLRLFATKRSRGPTGPEDTRRGPSGSDGVRRGPEKVRSTSVLRVDENARDRDSVFFVCGWCSE